VNLYEQLDLVNLKCEHREISYTMRNQIVLKKGFFGNGVQIVEMIESFFLFWYGMNWAQQEDVGYALGIYIKNIFGLNLEEFVASDSDWTCPASEYFDTRETFDDWKIGTW